MQYKKDYSKIDGIPNERWELAELIYLARIKEAWGNFKKDVQPPPREAYSHNKQVADFDLALACAKAILAKYELKAK